MTSPTYRLRPSEEKMIEENFGNEREAFALLDLINAEFQSDPTSTQCFDLRLVDRVRECIRKRKAFEKSSAFGWI